MKITFCRAEILKYCYNEHEIHEAVHALQFYFIGEFKSQQIGWNNTMGDFQLGEIKNQFSKATSFRCNNNAMQCNVMNFFYKNSVRPLLINADCYWIEKLIEIIPLDRLNECNAEPRVKWD